MKKGEIRMKLNDKIKELRKKNGLTQEELADKLNVSRQAITKWESGDGVPDIDNIKNIALFFHVSIDYLLDNKHEEIINLENKFKLLEIFLFIIGIFLGIVAENFEFGFVLCFLLPGITLCIENIVLNRKYRKENNILLQKELLEKDLPTDLYGNILNINDNAKYERFKQYLINSLLSISIIELFDIVGYVFNDDVLLTFNLIIFDNTIINNIFNIFISYLIGLLVFFIIECIINEIKVKRYNKIK